MKKSISILVFAFLLLFADFVKADDMIIDIDAITRNETILSMCWLNDSLYVLGTQGIYCVELGNPEIKKTVDLSNSTQYRYTQERPESAQEQTLWLRAIQFLYSDGEDLFGIHPYSGDVFMIAGGFVSIATIPHEILYSDELMGFREIKQVSYVDNVLFILLGTDNYDEPEKTELYAFDLVKKDTGVKLIENIQYITPGPSNSLIATPKDQFGVLKQYEYKNESFVDVTVSLPEMETCTGLLWSEKIQSYIYFTNGKIERMSSGGERNIAAYVPLTYCYDNTPVACSNSGMYALGSGNYIFIRDITVQEPVINNVLTVLGHLHPEMIIDFSVSHPDIAIVNYGNASAIDAALSSDASVDLFILRSPGDFRLFKEKGYVASFDDQNIINLVNTLYPEIRDVILLDDKVMGVPISLSINSWSINETIWQELALGNVPQTYSELFHKIGEWLDEYAEQYPDYCLSDIQQNGVTMLVEAVVREYVFQNEETEYPISFNTDTFRNVMCSIIDNSYLLSDEYDQWGMPIISSYSQGFGVSYTDGQKVTMLLPPSIDENHTQRMNASMELLAIHQASNRKEIAEEFVSWYVAHLDHTEKYRMSLELRDPIENPNYILRVNEITNEIDELNALISEGDTSNAVTNIPELIARKYNQLESLENIRWSISEESITLYRNMADKMRIAYDSVYFDESNGFSSIMSVISRFTADGLDNSELDALISELDRVAFMVYIESQ